MTETGLTQPYRRSTTAGMKGAIAMLLIGAAGATGGCVTVNAPDKPIEINLNVKIDQEVVRSEEHTSELQSLMRNSYAVFGLKHKNTHATIGQHTAEHTTMNKTRTSPTYTRWR